MPGAAKPVHTESTQLPPLICPAGGPIGSVDLRVSSPRSGGGELLPLRTINRLEEGDTLFYRPLLRAGEERKGEVAIVLVPANKAATGEKLIILEPKAADAPQQWKVPWRVAVVGYVYGPSGLNTSKVRNFLTRDDNLVAELADYAEKTAQTEALISALSSPNSSSAAVQAALQGFSSQYGLGTQIDRNAPPNQQAMTLFRTLNPALASYDPLSPQRTEGLSQTAGMATSVATLFFGSPVGVAAGGTAMLLGLRSVMFPKTELRSSFSQTLPTDGLGLCGRRDSTTAHTRVAFIWASRVPNVGPPQLTLDKANSLPMALKSPVPVTTSDAEWKVVERARNWAVQGDTGKPIPIKVQKLGDTRTLELEFNPAVRPGRYTLVANWDWEPFQVKGHVDVRPLSDFWVAKVQPASQDMLVARTGKVPVTLAGSDFEFVTKVEVEKAHDEFSTPSPVPFVLPAGLRQGPQDRMDVQVNTMDLDAGEYKLLISQLDGKAHPVSFKILTAPPHAENLPIVLNQGTSSLNYVLKGERLDLLKRLEVAKGIVELGPAAPKQTDRRIRLQMASDLEAGTSLAMKAYIEDRSEPLTFSDAVRIVGPRPRIISIAVAQPSDQDVKLDEGELPGGIYLSAMMRVEHLQSNSMVKLACEQPGGASLTLHLGERSGPLSLQQIAPDQMFLSFDTSLWLNGCQLQAMVANGNEGESDVYKVGRIVRVPVIDSLEVEAPAAAATERDYHAALTGQNLETIDKAGWNAEEGQLVTGLPIPVEGEGHKQKLRIRIPAPPADQATLYVWLRGEPKPRITTVHP